ncbi:MAG: 50S ribosomal protein L14 [Rickettsiales bacterium]|jgi:large subunit ribosomal protein L14|nr:50S ribosomal protein L14 [Rickettsiales bacterium]
MVQNETILKCVDNSGALTVRCIRILGKAPRCIGFPGDMVIVSIKTYRPHRKVKKGEIYNAVLVRIGDRITRSGHIITNCTSCGVVLLNKRALPLGSRVLGPVMKELRYKYHYKILSMAPAVI